MVRSSDLVQAASAVALRSLVRCAGCDVPRAVLVK
tara:strand:+ start:155 stop:259 length:105 start_codon:yes stop_codon:yes gene_type:complete